MKKFGFLISLLLIFCITFSKAGYIDEYPEAYKRAFKNGITTQKTIEKANMYGEITRIELSKMISNYAINVLKKSQNLSKGCDFTDISNELNKGYDLGVTKACQLGLMGQGITKFRPYDKVTRAEFGTILSRLLYGNKYNGGTPYYKNHLNQLNMRGIMNSTKNAEKINESRGNVMVMLKRSQEGGNIPSFEELEEKTSIKCHYEAEYWGEEDKDVYLTKGNFILPYKDGYFSYYFDGQDGVELYIDYRLTEEPCKSYLSSDGIFWFPPSYYEDFDYNKIYYGGKVVKVLNCKSGDGEGCFKEANKYAYNLLIGKETNEYFSFWMNELKRIIDNNKVGYNSGYRSKKFVDCIYKYENKYNVVFDNSAGGLYITDEEKQNNQQYLCKMEKINNYCSYEFINACSNNNCGDLKSEINKCNDIIVKTEPIKDERFPGYNVIYGGTGTSYQNIIGDKVVYYNDNVGISLKLGKEFDGGLIHDEYRHSRHLIFFYKKCPNCIEEELQKEGYGQVFIIQVFDNEDVYGIETPYIQGGGMSLIGKNNKYYFLGTKSSNYTDLNIFNVK